jgi:hypothetical protein
MVQRGGAMEVSLPRFEEGQLVDVPALRRRDSEHQSRPDIEFVRSFRGGRDLDSATKVDLYLQEACDSWGR